MAMRTNLQGYLSALCEALAEAKLMAPGLATRKEVLASIPQLEEAILAVLAAPPGVLGSKHDTASHVFATGSLRLFRDFLAKAPGEPEVPFLSADALGRLCQRAEVTFLTEALTFGFVSQSILRNCLKRLAKDGEAELHDTLLTLLPKHHANMGIHWIFDVPIHQLVRSGALVAPLLETLVSQNPERAPAALVHAIKYRKGVHAILLHLCGARLDGRTDMPQPLLETWLSLGNHGLIGILGGNATGAAFLQDPEAVSRAQQLFEPLRP